MNLLVWLDESSCLAWWIFLSGLMSLPVWIDESSCLAWCIFLSGMMNLPVWLDESSCLFPSGLMSPCSLISCFVWFDESSRLFLTGLMNLPVWLDESSSLAWWVFLCSLMSLFLSSWMSLPVSSCLAWQVEVWRWVVKWLAENSFQGLWWDARAELFKDGSWSWSPVFRMHWCSSVKKWAVGVYYLQQWGSTLTACVNR